MRNARFVLAGLAAVMILIGDCPTSEARGWLFGRCHRRNCSSASCPPCAANCGMTTDETVICPVQQTPYYAGQSGGVDYYMFYAQPYPQCAGVPQPLYLPSGSPVGCTGTSPPCFNSADKDNALRPPNLSDKGHRLTQAQLKGFGDAVGRYQIDIGMGGSSDPRNIDFYQLDIPKPRHWYEMWIGIENHLVAANYPPLIPYSVEDWDGHPYGKKVRLIAGGRPYYVLLHDPTESKE